MIIRYFSGSIETFRLLLFQIIMVFKINEEIENQTKVTEENIVRSFPTCLCLYDDNVSSSVTCFVLFEFFLEFEQIKSQNKTEQSMKIKKHHSCLRRPMLLFANKKKHEIKKQTNTIKKQILNCENNDDRSH